jgi:hypothetical protein
MIIVVIMRSCLDCAGRGGPRRRQITENTVRISQKSLSVPVAGARRHRRVVQGRIYRLRFAMATLMAYPLGAPSRSVGTRPPAPIAIIAPSTLPKDHFATRSLRQPTGSRQRQTKISVSCREKQSILLNRLTENLVVSRRHARQQGIFVRRDRQSFLLIDGLQFDPRGRDRTGQHGLFHYFVLLLHKTTIRNILNPCSPTPTPSASSI